MAKKAETVPKTDPSPVPANTRPAVLPEDQRQAVLERAELTNEPREPISFEWRDIDINTRTNACRESLHGCQLPHDRVLLRFSTRALQHGNRIIPSDTMVVVDRVRLIPDTRNPKLWAMVESGPGS